MYKRMNSNQKKIYGYYIKHGSSKDYAQYHAFSDSKRYTVKKGVFMVKPGLR